MSTITLPNIRVSSDLEIRLKLKDGGVAIDWSTLTNIKASIYSDRQRSLAGRCDIAIDEEDSTILVCRYSANKPQYPGVNRVIVSCTYDGETKTYDKPAFTFVRWTDDQAGQSITIDDPDIDVEITVEDISSSILQEAVEAANSAAERANDAAAAAEHMVDIHTGPAGADGADGKSAYELAVEEGYTGTEEEWLASLHGADGTDGTDGMDGMSAYEIAVDEGFVGTEEQWLASLKGEQGNTGSSVDYPYELVNNRTTDDATKGLSAAEGKRLGDDLSQLEAKVDGYTLTGAGNSSVNKTVSGLNPGHQYRAYIKSWPHDLVTSTDNSALFFISWNDSGTTRFLYFTACTSPLPSYADFVLPDGVSEIRFGGRINNGATGAVVLEDTEREKNFINRKRIEDFVSGYIKTGDAHITKPTTSSNVSCVFIPVNAGEQYEIRGDASNARLYAFYTYDSVNDYFTKNYVYTQNGNYRTSPRFVTIPSGTTHLAVNITNYDADYDGLWKVNNVVEDNTKLQFPRIEVYGMDGGFRRKVILNDYVEPGHTYRFFPTSWDSSVISGVADAVSFGIYLEVGGVSTRLSTRVTYINETPEKYYDFSVPENFDKENDEIRLTARLKMGVTGYALLEDITANNVESVPLSGADGAMATFMDAVQRKSDNIGLTSSTWNNPYGGRLYGFNRTTIRDLLKVTMYVAGNPRMMDFMGITSVDVKVWGANARVATIESSIRDQLDTYYQTLHGSPMPYKILAQKAGAHAGEDNLADNGFSLLVVAIVSGHYVAAVVGIGNTSQGYTTGRNNRIKGMVKLLDIVSAYYAGQDISGMSVTSCEKAIAAELPSVDFPQCYRKDSITTIHEQDADTVFMPASTSKVIAAVTMLDFLTMGEFYQITDNADELVNDSSYTAYAWDIQTVETSFYAMLVASSGANTLSLARLAGEKIIRGVNSL